MKKDKTKRRIPKWLSAAVAIVFWIGIWAAASVIINKELLVPSPLVVVQRLFALITEGSFWVKTGASILRIVGGFVIGCAAGVILAELSAVSAIAEAVVTPFIRIVRATPVMSFIMLVMLFVSYNFVPVYIAGLLVTPIMYLNVLNGIRKTDEKLLEVAHVYRFGLIKSLRFLYVPSVEPFFLSGAVTSLGLAWKSGIAAEVLCQLKLSIGGEMYFSKLYLETPDLFAWTIVIVLLSLALEKAFRRLVSARRLARRRFSSERFEDRSSSFIQKSDATKFDHRRRLGLTKSPCMDLVSGSHDASLVTAELGHTRRKTRNVFPGFSECTCPSDLCSSDSKENRLGNNGDVVAPREESHPQADSTLLKINGLSVSFGDQKVLSNLNLEISDGITCIMGESGAGKTTLLRTISGLQKPDEGEITGVPERVAFMFQGDRLFPWLTAVENVSAVCDDESKSRRLLELFELSGHEGKFPSELSGGMQRRVALARAIAFEGDLLILDEPFKGLDAALTDRVCAFLRTLSIPIVIATHDESDILRLNAAKVTL